MKKIIILFLIVLSCSDNRDEENRNDLLLCNGILILENRISKSDALILSTFCGIRYINKQNEN
jgi:hypothetical protein